MSPALTIQIVSILIAISCSLLGVFLVLKSMAMLTDAISHTVLLGIIISFFIVKDLSSPLLVVGAASVGILTVYLVEVLVNTKLVKEDAAIGVVLSFLFSIAVILISKYASNIHIDTDTVLLGELAFTPFNVVKIGTFKISKNILSALIIFLINVLYIKLFFKELKISIFDKALAHSLGLYPVLMHYSLMTLVSATSVISFEAVGSILLISFMIGGPASAYVLSKNLKEMIVYSLVIEIFSCIVGYYVAIYLDVSISGAISVIIGIIFLVVIFLKNLLKKVKI